MRSHDQPVDTPGEADPLTITYVTKGAIRNSLFERVCLMDPFDGEADIMRMLGRFFATQVDDAYDHLTGIHGTRWCTFNWQSEVAELFGSWVIDYLFSFEAFPLSDECEEHLLELAKQASGAAS